VDRQDPVTPPRPAHSGGRLRAWAWYVVAALCLAWILHDFHPAEFAREIANLRWGWVAAAAALEVLSYAAQGWRWQLLLRPLGRLRVLETTQAVYVGLFANEVLPLRAGELVRAWLVARWLSTGLAATLPSIALERLFDMVWLAVAFGLTAILVPLPNDLMRAGDVLGVVTLASAGLFVLVLVRHPHAGKRMRWAGPLLAGLREIGRSRGAYVSLAVSGLILALQAAAFWAAVVAYGLHLSFWACAAVMLIVRLGTAVPNAPANVGTFQFFTVIGLAAFGVPKAQATGFSLVVFALLTAPLWALGFLALSRSGATLHDIRAGIEQASPGKA
jgi:uncharacterized membrane protein YbhN (UPF0104 family)